MSYKEFCNRFYIDCLSGIIVHAKSNTIWIEKRWETVGAWNHWTLEISDKNYNLYYCSDIINNEKIYDDAENILRDLFEEYF